MFLILFTHLFLVNLIKMMTSDKTYYFVHYGYDYYMWQMEV